MDVDALPRRARRPEPAARPRGDLRAGRVAGEQLKHFPWAWKASNLVGVKPAQIEIDHTPRRQWFRIARRAQRPHLGAVPRRRDGHVRHPRPRTARRGDDRRGAQSRRRTSSSSSSAASAATPATSTTAPASRRVWRNMAKRAGPRCSPRRRATFRQTLPLARVNPYRILSDRTFPAHGRGFHLGHEQIQIPHTRGHARARGRQRSSSPARRRDQGHEPRRRAHRNEGERPHLRERRG